MKQAYIWAIWLALSTPLFAAPLATVTAHYQSVEQYYRIDGVVEAVNLATVSAQRSGMVQAIYVDAGDQVKKGQVLLRLDSRETEQSQLASQAQLTIAQAQLAQSEASYQRAKQELELRTISREAFDINESAYKTAQAQLTASLAQQQQANIQHSYNNISAPSAWVVSKRLVEVGEIVSPGKPLLQGYTPSNLRVVVQLPQQQLERIQAQPKIQLPNQRWLTPIRSVIQPRADAHSHSREIRFELKPDPALYPGMSVQAQFVVGNSSKLFLPSSAILKRNEVYAVYIVGAKQQLSLRQVRVGETNTQGQIEILSGINEGEVVALEAVKAGTMRH